VSPEGQRTRLLEARAAVEDRAASEALYELVALEQLARDCRCGVSHHPRRQLAVQPVIRAVMRCRQRIVC